MTKSTRTLRNEIARAMAETRPPLAERHTDLRFCLQDAQAVVEALQSYVLVFGPEALINAL